MTLHDAAIDRYSRQILVPDIGGVGQERLLAARVTVLGTGLAARAARDLLDRAGVGDGPHADVLIVFDREVASLEHAHASDGPPVVVVAGVAPDGLVVAAQPGHPCPACLRVIVGNLQPATGAAHALALGALAVGMTLQELLHPTSIGRVTRVREGGLPLVTDLTPLRACTAGSVP